jgi:hypothetical protein
MWEQVGRVPVCALGNVHDGRALSAVEDFDVIEHRRLGLLAGAEAGLGTCSFFSAAKKLSIGALSRQSPRRLMGGMMPCRSSTAR